MHTIKVPRTRAGAQQKLTPFVAARSSSPVTVFTFPGVQGVDYLRQRLAEEHSTLHAAACDCKLMAADTDTDAVFCLLEYKIRKGDTEEM